MFSLKQQLSCSLLLYICAPLFGNAMRNFSQSASKPAELADDPLAKGLIALEVVDCLFEHTRKPHSPL